MSLKILLISPIGLKKILGADFFFKLPFLGLPTVAAHTPPDCEVKMVDERISPVDFTDDADLIGISVMTPLATRAYEVADEFKRRGKTVVMGGMHVSALPEEALEHCDAVAIGEGEKVWPQMVEDFKRGELKEVYRADKLLDLGESLPPRWDIIDKTLYSPVDFIETTRGCPINCNFCAVTQFYGAKYRIKPIHLVEEMVARVRPVDKIFALKNLIFFVDDNIVANRKHCMALLKMLKSYNIQWLGQASISVAKDDELLKLMSETRCLGLLIGMESLSEDTLAECGKRINKPAEYLEAVANLHRYGIGVKATFIIGFDNDDILVFPKMARFINRSNFDSVYFSILTPYPGTRLFEKMESEGRLLHKDWERYDTAHVVFRPRKMTVEQLEEGFVWLYKRALSMKSIVLRLARARTNPQFFLPDNLAFRSCLFKMLRGNKKI
ncbi:MAG: B12-binding domain-containing radical SAM protein [Deltaproteobacteria bacterium]|nr:B12-binding domain-containing radical SAM protein [Deltaproteobacteria bacterium]